MSFTYRFHPSAQEEYESSVSWYLERNLKAATDFVNAVENGIAKTCKNPYLHRNIYKNYHEFNIQKYPFTIVYTIEDPSQMIIVIAVHHQKRAEQEISLKGQSTTKSKFHNALKIKQQPIHP